MNVTEKAAQRLKDNLIQRFINTGLGFRISNKDGEVNQTEISIQVDHKHEGDKVIYSHDIKIFLDPETATNFEDYDLDLNDPDSAFCLKIHKNTGTTSR